MSMRVLTLIQLLEIVSAYSIMTLMLPALLLYRKIKHMRFTIRFMIYQTVSNFFIMNLVFVLQLLHISNFMTLTGCTVIIFFIAYISIHKVNMGGKLDEFVENVRRLAEGQFGLRLFLRKIKKRLGAGVKTLCSALWKRFWGNKLDCVLVIAVMAAFVVSYGKNAFESYGYCAADIIVHNYWINALSRGELFVAGVYPFGFHCVIYYLHIVFHIETYVLLRLFWFVQSLLIHFMLLAFIRICCKSRYAAYAGILAYMFVKVFQVNTYSRYVSSLPQEFGMVFILPAIAFLFLFFEQKKKELSKSPKKGRRRHGKRRPRQEEALKEEAPEEEERIYLLDEVLAESAAREASGQALPKQQQEAQPETIITIEENKKDGTLFIKKVPLAQDAGNGNAAEAEAIKDIEGIEETENVEKQEKKHGKHKLRKWLGNALKREAMLESSQYLTLFAMCFSMTLAIHFYNTMIAGLFCLGVAVGFFFRLFRWRYFGRVVCAGILSIVVSLLPMFLAYVGGTPLEGSLMWGMSIMDGSAEDSDESPSSDEDFELTDLHGFVFISGSTVIYEGEIISENGELQGGEVLSLGDVTVGQHTITGGQLVDDATILVDGEVYYEGIVIAVGKNLKEKENGQEGASGSGTDGKKGQQGVQRPAPQKQNSRLDNVLKKIQNFYIRMKGIIQNVIGLYLMDDDVRDFTWLNYMISFSILFLFILAVLYYILRQVDYASRMMSTAVYMALMTVMFIASDLGLPELMDQNRASIYYAYSVIAVWSLCADGVLNLLLGWFRSGKVLNFASVLLVPALAAVTVSNDMVRHATFPTGFQSNEAVTCLTNIIRENKNGTWTIVSANDEMRMGEDYGYHYEVDTFLRKMEHRGSSGSIRIPTQKVYFFIEKRPIDYYYTYEGSGQKVSARGASNPLPRNNGMEMYWMKSRWIEMSRMYYWARQFAWLYPNEISTYYETDDFVCYLVEQNGFSYYNFSIDYHYNMQNYTQSTEE